MKDSQNKLVNLGLKSLKLKDDKNSDSEVIARLEEKIQKLEDDRNEERFVWCLIIVLLLDFLLFPSLNNWAAAIIIGIFEIILFIILARKFQIDEVEKIFNKILDGFSNNGKH